MGFNTEKINEKIIIALDFDDIDQALRAVDKIGDIGAFYKIGNILFTRYGPGLVSELKRRDKKIFLDLKYHDIPNTVEGACYQAGILEVDLLTIHLCGGLKMIQAAVRGADKAAEQKGNRPKVLGVSVLTSMGSEELKNEMSVSKNLEDQVGHLVRLGHVGGVDGIVCSPLETKAMRQMTDDDFLIVNPGVRLMEDAAGDQTRIAEPKQAFADGASHIVMGRPIYKADNPAEKLNKVISSIAD